MALHTDSVVVCNKMARNLLVSSPRQRLLPIPGGMGGKEVVREIQKMNIAMPVFVVSGYAQDPIMKNREAYGFTASLSKPFRQIELIEMIGAYIGTV
ncbi:response regulator [Pelobacter seleniigenes]|uniref:response regulator n=1 Tax=Pelobacter seleniigenes TaxID=407188 RepID=UPI00138DF057|nr:response regulator [Pelobacter seleniigenes]